MLLICKKKVSLKCDLYTDASYINKKYAPELHLILQSISCGRSYISCQRVKGQRKHDA